MQLKLLIGISLRHINDEDVAMRMATAQRLMLMAMEMAMVMSKQIFNEFLFE